MKQTWICKLRSHLKGMAILYAVLLTVFVLMQISAIRIMNQGGNMTFGGLGVGTVIFCFVTGISVASEDLRFFIANGVSRRTQFQAQLLAFAVAVASMALIESLFGYIAAQFTVYRSMYAQVFDVIPHVMATGSLPMGEYGFHHLPVNFLWSCALYLLSFGLGVFFSALFKRTPRKIHIWLRVGIAVFVIIVLPKLNEWSGYRLSDLLIQLYGGTALRHALMNTIFAGLFLLTGHLLFKKTPVGNTRS